MAEQETLTPTQHMQMEWWPMGWKSTCDSNNLFLFFPSTIFSEELRNYNLCLSLVSTVKDLLERTVISGEGNSLLIVGSQGCGKSWVCDITI